jgi:signal peptidase
MDEGDRPETDGDPAERSGTSNETGDERDETEGERNEGGDGHDETERDETELTDVGDGINGGGATDAGDATDTGDETEAGGATDTDDQTDTDDSGRSADRGEESGISVSGDGSIDGRGRRRDRSDPEETKGFVYRFRHDKEGPLMWVREMLTSVAVVLAIGLVLFAISGVWPPMVAVESGSMEPNMQVGDLVFVTEPGRLAPDAADNDVGVVTYDDGRAADYRTFGSYGSVIIYRPPGRTASPIIHRAMFHVEEGEDWYDRADEEYHRAAGCAELRHCPAPHDGFITLGDNNGAYDQANGLSPPVRAEWVTGVARVRVPYLGYVRLIASGQAEPSDVLATTAVTGSGIGGFGADAERRGANELDAVAEPEAVEASGLSGGESGAIASV